MNRTAPRESSLGYITYDMQLHLQKRITEVTFIREIT